MELKENEKINNFFKIMQNLESITFSDNKSNIKLREHKDFKITKVASEIISDRSEILSLKLDVFIKYRR